MLTFTTYGSWDPWRSGWCFLSHPPNPHFFLAIFCRSRIGINSALSSHPSWWAVGIPIRETHQWGRWRSSCKNWLLSLPFSIFLGLGAICCKMAFTVTVTCQFWVELQASCLLLASCSHQWDVLCEARRISTFLIRILSSSLRKPFGLGWGQIVYTVKYCTDQNTSMIFQLFIIARIRSQIS